MSSNLKVNTILPSTGTNVAIGTAGGSITMVGNVDIDINSGISTFNDIHISDKIVHDGDTNTAIRFPANDTISFETSGSERLRIQSNGRVGIGEDDPQVKLHQHESSSAANYHQFTNSGTGNAGGDGGIVGIDANENLILWNQESTALRLATNNTERLRISSGGKIGINNTSPTSQLDGANDLVIGDTSDADSGITLVTTTSGQGLIHFSDATSGNARYDGFIGYEQSTRALKFGTAQTERLRIASDGTTTFKNSTGGTIKVGGSAAHTSKIVIASNDGTANGNCLVEGGDGSDFFTIQSNGNVAFENGKGINFGATEGSGATTSVLDDYEEGSFTPYIRTNGNGTEPSYSHRLGLYTKVGNLVTWVVRITTSGELSTGSGATEMWGLPFAAMNWTTGDWPGGAHIAYYNNLRGNYGTNPRLLGPFRNGTFLRFHTFNAQNDTSNNAYNHIFTNNTIMIMNGHYYTDA